MIGSAISLVSAKAGAFIVIFTRLLVFGGSSLEKQ